MISVSYQDRGKEITAPLYNHNGELDTAACIRFLEQGKIDKNAQSKLLTSALNELHTIKRPEEYSRLRDDVADKQRTIDSLRAQIQSLSEGKKVKRSMKRDTIRRNDKAAMAEEKELLLEIHAEEEARFEQAALAANS